jgi:hypothetical protein
MSAVAPINEIIFEMLGNKYAIAVQNITDNAPAK